MIITIYLNNEAAGASYCIVKQKVRNQQLNDACVYLFDDIIIDCIYNKVFNFFQACLLILCLQQYSLLQDGIVTDHTNTN